MNKIILTLLCFFLTSKLFAQPIIEWQKCLGGSQADGSNSIQQTTDGGYIVGGYTDSNDGDVTNLHVPSDYWIVKLDNVGSIEWQKCLGGSNDDYANSIQQTIDSGYIVAGISKSNDGDVSGNHGLGDYWIVKLDNAGNIQWQKCLGGSNEDYAYAIQQTFDSGYIVTGYTTSTDGDVTGFHTLPDFWTVKLNSFGIDQWQKCLGGSNIDIARAVQQTLDGCYIIAGETLSHDGDVTGIHGSNNDFWIVKLSSSGSLEWQKTYGGSMIDQAYSIQQTLDSGYIVAGRAYSTDGDVNGLHGTIDCWIVKLNSTGSIQWNKCLGGASAEEAYNIKQTSDGGYIIAGKTRSTDGDVTGNHGGLGDFWVIKLSVTIIPQHFFKRREKEIKSF